MIIEIAYAIPAKQEIITLDLDKPCSVKEAIERSKIIEHFPEIDLEKNKVGIFGKAVKLTDILRDKDRVEIYRPLIADPKESRRARAAKKERNEKK